MTWSGDDPASCSLQQKVTIEVKVVMLRVTRVTRVACHRLLSNNVGQRCLGRASWSGTCV